MSYRALCISSCDRALLVRHKVVFTDMGWLGLVGSLMYVSFAKEPYKRDDILQKRRIILSSLLIVATPHRAVFIQGSFCVIMSCRALFMPSCHRALFVRCETVFADIGLFSYSALCVRCNTVLADIC